jgi:hypothetical protein
MSPYVPLASKRYCYSLVGVDRFVLSDCSWTVPRGVYNISDTVIGNCPLIGIAISYAYPVANRLIGSYVSGFGINITLTCFQAVEIYLYAREALSMQHRCGNRCASTVSSLPADLNGLKAHNAHFILD